MHAIAELMAERIASGLKRKSLTTCSRWTEECRVISNQNYHGKWSWKYHPWTREMHDSEARFNVGMKSAQMGFTETVLNKTLFKLDMSRCDCLYVLPAEVPNASQFSQARFNPAIELSPYLRRIFAGIQNVGHKQAGTSNLYIRGSRSRANLKEIPVGFLVLDEVEEMDQRNIPLALERQSGQLEREAWAISTPRNTDRGIHKLFKATTQEHFMFVCPKCSRTTELVFPDCLEIIGDSDTDPRVRDSFIKCKECKNRLDHETKPEWLGNGQWQPSYANRFDRGFYINQLYSCVLPPWEFAMTALKAMYDPASEQELWNSKMGLPHEVEGARITDTMIDQCIAGHVMQKVETTRPITMGVDIGKWIHYVIEEWLTPSKVVLDIGAESTPKVIKIGKCLSFEELEEIAKEYRVNYAVVDGQPERRESTKFCNKFHGYTKMCFYVGGVVGKEYREIPGPEPIVQVNRTSWLDAALGRFKSRKILLPRDTPEEYKVHLKVLIRQYGKDSVGNPTAAYDNDEKDDHYAHARNYSEIAFKLLTQTAIASDIIEDVI